MNMHDTISQLNRLADLYGLKTSYLDMGGRVKPASHESLLAILKAMGAPVSTFQDIPSAIREKEQQYWQRPLEPVIAVWENEKLAVILRLPFSSLENPISASLTLETGEETNLTWKGEISLVLSSAKIEGTEYGTLRFYFPVELPPGYHRLRLAINGREFESLIISAPMKAYAPPHPDNKIWGVFLPLYSLHSSQSWGAGNYSDMEKLMSWISRMGGSLVGTLPLLPVFYFDKMGPGPYMPASRLFWNEFYLDINRIPELERCPQAQELLNSRDFQKEISNLRSMGTVDYCRELSLKRSAIEALAEDFFEKPSERFRRFQCFIDSNPMVEDYARFRAAGEQHGLCWPSWPREMRNGLIKEDDYSRKTLQYYLFSQWLTQEQIQGLNDRADQDKITLYLDLPIGVHPYSYDVWREKESFVQGVYGGAPPDPVFTSGQNWNFPPLHPEKIREQGYHYVINSLRHQLQQASMLRLDHMMGFHRLFWIPEGMENSAGVYVGYRAEELYAILTLEACRHKSVIIGEDLGIVPPEVRPMMEKHGIYRMFVSEYELISENRLGKIPAQSIASINTHDMFPFAAFWQEYDIPERQELKLLDAAGAQKEIAQRHEVRRTLSSILQYMFPENEAAQDAEAALRAVLSLLASSAVYAVLVNLEDLWLETQPQNIPGTVRNQNWTRKALYSIEEFSQVPQVIDILQNIDRARKGVSNLP